MTAAIASAILAFAPAPAYREGKPCIKLFTVQMAVRAIQANYAGVRHVSQHDLRKLAWYERCQRNANATPFVKTMDRRYRHAWWLRCHPVFYTQLASWYTDQSEGTACGFHAYYGVANKALPCGTHVIARYHGRQITMVVQDRGPYVGDRRWDLGQNAAAALGFGGVDAIQVSVYSPY